MYDERRPASRSGSKSSARRERDQKTVVVGRELRVDRVAPRDARTDDARERFVHPPARAGVKDRGLTVVHAVDLDHCAALVRNFRKRALLGDVAHNVRCFHAREFVARAQICERPLRTAGSQRFRDAAPQCPDLARQQRRHALDVR
jgi:hypothetical protein